MHYSSQLSTVISSLSLSRSRRPISAVSKQTTTVGHFSALMPRTPRRWTDQEDQVLLQGVASQGGPELRSEAVGQKRTDRIVERSGAHSMDWNVISRDLQTRTNKDCRKRWLKIVQSRNRGLWDVEEENLLQKAVEQYGKRYDRCSRPHRLVSLIS